MSGNSIPSADAIGAIRDLAFDAAGISIEYVSHPEPESGVPETVPVAVARGRSPSVSALAHVFEPYRTRPARKTGTARALTLQSLIDLTNRHATEHSAIFADTDWKKPSITVVVDYHKLDTVVGAAQAEASAEDNEKPEDASLASALADDIVEPGEPDFGKHRIHYAFPLSEPWKAWVEKDGEVMEQGDFAAFIEDHIAELSAPTDAEKIWLERDFQTTVATPAQLIQLSRGLQVNVNAVVKNAVTLQTGEGQVTFVEEHVGADGKPLKVPGIFLLSVAPFFMGEKISIPVRLRYRPSGSKVRWFFQIYRPDEHITARVRADLRKAAEATGLPTYEGTPEMSA